MVAVYVIELLTTASYKCSGTIKYPESAIKIALSVNTFHSNPGRAVYLLAYCPGRSGLRWKYPC